MPTYDFKCRKCERIQQNVLLRITHDDADKPHCCGDTMDYHITTPPMVHWKDPIIDAFRPIATKNAPVIHSQRENREYMARHDLVDANDFGPPPSQKEQMEEAAEMQQSIDAITPTAEQAKRLKEDGLDTILET